MPIYEYECSACKTRFERSQRFSDPPVSECPECGGAVRRVLFPAGIVFKGSGWYITDSRKSSSGDGAGAASETASDTGSAAAETGARSDGKPGAGAGDVAAKGDGGAASTTPSAPAKAD